MVVEFNPTATTLLGCNTNYSFLGSHAQSLASLYYVLKYLTKSPTEAAHCLVLYHNARKRMDLYPSQATDSGSPVRNTQHFIVYNVNRNSSIVEVSLSVAALALLGGRSEISSHGFHNVYVNAAMEYARTQPNYIPPNENEFDDLHDVLEGDEEMENNEANESHSL